MEFPDVITVRVKPRARTSSILNQEGDVFTVSIAAPPEDGKANAELERFLSKSSGKQARIIRGRRSKHKLVRFYSSSSEK